MADFPLQIDVPSRETAEHIQLLVQRALGVRGTVHLNLPGERLPDAPSVPGYIITGIATCDEPQDEMLHIIQSVLVDFKVEESEMPDGAIKLDISTQA